MKKMVCFCVFSKLHVFSALYFSIVSFDILMDRKEFRSSVFQRAFQYLRRHKARMSLDRFSYLQNSVEGKITECLNMLLRSVGIV